MLFEATGMDLGIVILSEVRHRRKKFMASLICGIEK